MIREQPALYEQESSPIVVDMRAEHRRDALGIGSARPRLSWTVASTGADWSQAGYQIELCGSEGLSRGQTGRIDAPDSVLAPWPFAPLASRERATVRVQVWDVDGMPSAWSEPLPIEAGLLHDGDWVARFVTPAWDEDTTQPQPCPLLRREFHVRTEKISRARLYVTALGLYEVQINGRVAGDHVLAPGWTSYNHRLRYQTFDITDMLRGGANAIGATLADGWYRGRLGFGSGRRDIYGDRLALLAQLEIEYVDGTTDLVVTDDTWQASTGPLLASELYDGEKYDARLERPGWTIPGYDNWDWASVRVLEHDLATLVAPAGPPVRRIELVAPVSVSTSPTGRTIVDFGQNLVGRLRLTVAGRAGETITLRHAEVLQDGDLCTRPLRYAKAIDCYTMRGDPAETWEPRFTYHGFRYAEVDGWPGDLRAEDLRAVVCHSDLERAGWFECSDPLVNRLHENVVWSMRGNFVDIPTDCPQRDERLGWTGDIQVFAPTASFLYDVAGFLTSWLADLAAEQEPSGSVPYVIPNVLGGNLPPAAAWGDAAVIVPWVLYQRFGDASVLAAQFDSMHAWVECLSAVAGESHLWNSGFQFGDWLDPAAPPERPGDARTDRHLVATAYFARSAELLGRAAAVLGRETEAAQYAALAARVREAFNDEYASPAGRLVSDTTTAYALALQFGLLREPARRRHAGERLVELVRDSGYHISTGFVGTPLICDALCDSGAYDAAFRLLTQRDCPSWLYPVTMGATTIWERWDSMLPDGTVNPGEMTSFNHYALGAVADWLHRTVGGLAPAEPGYRRLSIRPTPGGGLTWARARHITPYGPAEVFWKLDGDQIELTVEVPPNTTAGITLPLGEAEPIEVGSGTHRWTYAVRSSGRPPVSVDSTLIAVYEDAEAWNAVLSAAPGLSRFEVGMHGSRDVPLRQLISLLPNAGELLQAVDAALRSRNRR